jgi:integrase
MAERITQKLIEKLEARESGNRIVYDDDVRGFGVRITNSGVKSFILNYRINRRERRYTIGRCDEWTVTAAREKAVELRGEIAKGTDPMKEREALWGAPTFADLAREYMEDAERRKRCSSLRNDRSMLNSILKPQLGNRHLAEIDGDVLSKIHRSLKPTPYRANRVLSLASGMFGWATRNDQARAKWGITDNPAKGIERYHEDKRETWLSKVQLEELENALSNYPDPYAADAIRLLILTGSREGEVLNAEWSQFDLKRATWTKPSHHTKQKKIEHVPLSDAAVILLKRIHARRNGSSFLFPGHQTSKARATLRRPWVQVCKAAGLATAVPFQGKRRQLVRYKPTVRIHDLRHSFASHLVSKGESLHVVGKLLGHTQPQTTARYAHVADAALREAANRFGDDIYDKAVKERKVVPMKQRALIR